jgi:hypothetical protein
VSATRTVGHSLNGRSNHATSQYWPNFRPFAENTPTRRKPTQEAEQTEKASLGALARLKRVDN